jgi:hypothetical protein
MQTVLSPQARNGAEPTPADAGTTIADDRLEGTEAIRDFIDPGLSVRQVRRRLGAGVYPCWKEGHFFVASKAALLRHWREKTTQLNGQPAGPRSRRRSRLASR